MSFERPPRRRAEEPSAAESRNYTVDGDALLVSMTDIPFYPPFMPDAQHVHNCMEIGLCLAGKGTVHLGREQRFAFSPGSLVLVPRGVPHSQQHERGELIRWRYIALNEDYLLHRMPRHYQTELAPMLAAAAGGVFLARSAEVGAQALFSLMFSLRESGSLHTAQQEELCALLLLTLILHQAESAPAPEAFPVDAHSARQPLKPALAYVREHFRENVKIGDMARSCSMSESYFRRVFTRSMGLAPLEFVNRYRVQRSMYLLRITSEPVQNIAARVGFSSIAAFNRNFRSFAGMSPGAWRRMQTDTNPTPDSRHLEQYRSESAQD